MKQRTSRALAFVLGALLGTAPLWADLQRFGGGGSIISGTTSISGGADTQVCFNDAAKLSCGDAGLVYNKTTDTLTATNIGATTFTGLVNITASGGNALTFTSPALGAFWGGAAGGRVGVRTENTPDAFWLSTGTTINSLHIAEDADTGTDVQNGGSGTAASVDPTLYIHDASAAATQYAGITNAGLYGTLGIALGEGAATSFLQINVASGTGTGGVLEYTVHANDATNFQTRGGGLVRFSVNNIGGTETCTMAPAAPDQTNDGNSATISSGTLVYTVTCSTSPTNGILFQANATSSLTQTTLKIDGQVRLYGTGEIRIP